MLPLDRALKKRRLDPSRICLGCRLNFFTSRLPSSRGQPGSHYASTVPSPKEPSSSQDVATSDESLKVQSKVSVEQQHDVHRTGLRTQQPQSENSSIVRSLTAKDERTHRQTDKRPDGEINYEVTIKKGSRLIRIDTATPRPLISKHETRSRIRKFMGGYRGDLFPLYRDLGQKAKAQEREWLEVLDTLASASTVTPEQHSPESGHASRKATGEDVGEHFGSFRRDGDIRDATVKDKTLSSGKSGNGQRAEDRQGSRSGQSDITHSTSLRTGRGVEGSHVARLGIKPTPQMRQARAAHNPLYAQDDDMPPLEPDRTDLLELLGIQRTTNQQTAVPASSTMRTSRLVGSPASSSLSSSYSGPVLRALAAPKQPRSRLLHYSARAKQEAAGALTSFDDGSPPPAGIFVGAKYHKHSRIRQELRQWQQDHGNPSEDTKDPPTFDVPPMNQDGVLNSMTRLPNTSTLQRSAMEEEGEYSTLDQLPSIDKHDGLASEGANDDDNSEYLRAGDLVEINFTGSDSNGVLAVFVQRTPSLYSQFFTMQGRWVFMKEKKITWSVPGWASEAEIAPLIEHMPMPTSLAEMNELKEKSQTEDLSVPRTASAPMVNRLVQFWSETQEVYRKHASVLDDAHNLLAHKTDLRYGSLVTVASTLLQIPAQNLPLTSLHAVRTALSRAPLAFNIDSRSHRITGYLQIRSKEQVRMVHCVRDWLRDWQDDIAARSQLSSEAQLRKHKTRKGAQYIYDFLEKARKIVLESRKDRGIVYQSTCGNIGISQKRFPIKDGGQAVRVTTDTQFTQQDTEIVRFVEGWCVSGLLLRAHGFASLPPMILKATGLYEEFEQQDQTIGFTFLQELGVLMPYENRTKFDPHLLLPSSQHSKPLQNLMETLFNMRDEHGFEDSMEELRRDWGSMPVYCVDDAGAQEIDDGVSIEPVNGTEGEYWLHAHVANPTAFFGRDHPLAKMARHMGESMYMPERTYTMMPRWATTQHFSLGNNRPCITFSTRVNSDAAPLERKVTPGIVRNVYRLTPGEVTHLLGKTDPRAEKMVLTVGGDPPPKKESPSMVGSLTEEMVQSLKTMAALTEKLFHARSGTGRFGLFVDNQENDIAVWQSERGEGLAWDSPWRRGSRTVEGDPIIEFRTNGFINWFAPQIPAGVVMVREMMLLANESAALWCAERDIPTIFRGTVRRPVSIDAEAFYEDVVAPAVEKYGEVPAYLGFRYMRMQGDTGLRTKPLPHKTSGLKAYVKATSPLRRYGDMIVHWQIEAALREEARRGRSLSPQDTAEDPSFLPFSTSVLDTIMLGLKPRERLISRCEGYSRDFWQAMLMFRAHHFGECELPFAATRAESASTGKPLLQVFLYGSTAQSDKWPTMAKMLNMGVQLDISPRNMVGLEQPLVGDTWEVEIEFVDVYRRIVVARPLRLVDRPVDENLARWEHLLS